jgi:hypothetical protein
VKYLRYVAWAILALDGNIILDGETITDPHELKDRHIYVFDHAAPGPSSDGKLGQHSLCLPQNVGSRLHRLAEMCSRSRSPSSEINSWF